MLKIKVLFCNLILFTSLFSWAGGDVVGNGGGLWTCKDKTGALKSAQLVDLYEAKEEFGYLVAKDFGSADQIVNERMNIVARDLPEIYPSLKSNLQQVQDNIRYVGGILQVVNDSLYRISPNPKTCQDGVWTYEQFANYTNLGSVLIQKDLWDQTLVLEQDKAALLIHEATYNWLRSTKNDQNSIRARWIVGIIFSQLTSSERQAELTKAMSLSLNPTPSPVAPQPVRPAVPTYACYLESNHNSSASIGYGSNILQGQTEAVKACGSQAGGDQFFCSENDVKCEKQEQEEVFFCRVISHNNNSVSDGSGHSKVEALYRAMHECMNQGDHFFCLTAEQKCEKTESAKIL